MTDPIAVPGFNPWTKRSPNQATMSELKAIADDFHAAKDVARDLRQELDLKIKTAWDSGHSYNQIRDATGFAVATIQQILRKRAAVDGTLREV